ncbi:MAG TPA: hypothetical protein VG711_04025, partial [Phycisphaerales bacterium]|nr:hypothetical protein [Phycisphaerales bacterium]
MKMFREFRNGTMLIVGTVGICTLAAPTLAAPRQDSTLQDVAAQQRELQEALRREFQAAMQSSSQALANGDYDGALNEAARAGAMLQQRGAVLGQSELND